MSVGPVAVELIAVFCLAIFLLHQYGNIRVQHPVVTFATLLAWYFSLIIVFILPLDVSSALFRQCLLENDEMRDLASDEEVNTTRYHYVMPIINSENYSNVTYCKKPFTYVSQSMLPTIWRIVYWSSQSLTWVLLPFLQSYTCCGHFSTLGKLKHALVKNAVYYGTYVLIFILLMIYVAASPNITLNFSQLKVIGITASNTWGLFLLVLLLGYGLVEVPRSVWRAASPVQTMAYTQFKLAKLSTDKQEALEAMDDILAEIKSISESIRYNNPLRQNVDIIIKKCPKEFQDKLGRGVDDYVEYDGPQRIISEKVLVQLHTKLIHSIQKNTRNMIQWNILMKRAIYLDLVLKNLKQTRRVWHNGIFEEEQPVFWTAALRWYWECKIKSALLRGGAICLIGLSIIVIWSECTFFNRKPVLSIFAIFVNLAKKTHSYFYIEMTSCMIIAYLCLCAYYTIFHIKFFNIYYIAGHHQTSESSLIFIGMMLCRLTPPMCLNFLGLIQMDTHIAGDALTETSYTGIMGHLDVIPIISNGFNIYFPILVVVLCIATFVSLGHRCLSCLGFQQFIDSQYDDEFTADLIDEGRQLVDRELRRLAKEMKQLGHENRQRPRSISKRKWLGRVMKGADTAYSCSAEPGDRVELLCDVESVVYTPVDDWESGDLLHDACQQEQSVSWGYVGDDATRRSRKGIFDDL